MVAFPEWITLKIDFTNAFNEIDREVILQAVKC